MSDLPKRERKQVDAYRVETIAPTIKSVSIQTGTGIKLSEYPFFLKGLDKLKGDDDLVKAIHSLLFNAAGKKLETKKNIRLFCGFADEKMKEDKKSKVLDAKKKWTVQLLKDSMALFGLEKSGSRNELTDRLIDYLMTPSALKEEGAKGGAKKSSSTAAKTKGTKRKAKEEKVAKKPRAPSSYILFSAANRHLIKDANPDSSFAEIGVLLGQKWKALDEDEKKVWTDLSLEKAAALKEAQAEAGEGDAEEEEEDDDDNDDDLFGDGDALYGGDEKDEKKEEKKDEEEEEGEEEKEDAEEKKEEA